MAHYSGSAVDMAALRSALISACTVNGWSWNSGTNVLSKGSLHLLLTNDSLNLSLTGRTAEGSGDMPNAVQLGRLMQKAGAATLDVTYPAQWECFVFTGPDEVWFVVQYDVDRYQWCSFGGSAVAGLAGTGMWVSAIRGSVPISSVDPAMIHPFAIRVATGGAIESVVGGMTSGAWGWNTVPRAFSALRDIYLHSDLDGHGWHLNEASLTGELIGVRGFSQLIQAQPSAWNNEAALIPMRAYKMRPSFKTALVADLVNIRHVRIDNYFPGQIIELGSDRWKVYPWHRRNAVERNGGAPGEPSWISKDHTGTFGYAIRYDGP
ncbi:hypothetical protein [Pseudomonas spirodelae]|uniref:Minor tail protein n=1 Tax=Pseudomonas spirodelae TaxID=3101751 RepID=A0ABU5P7V4_9PSED|nr:hypothetical protein [Pseudomonas sp. T5W1]MEA1605731.1 hypothetical protein [Pseudomonas sp. T5W1]